MRSLRTQHQQHGFSLIELLIVITIILILASIAVPNLLRAKMAANEASAAASLRQISTANAVYSTVYGVGYAGALAQLGPVSASCPLVSPACADLIDSNLSGVNPATPTPIKSGYQFKYFPAVSSPSVSNPNLTFSAVGAAVSLNSTGVKSYCVDHSKSLREDATGALTTGAPEGCTGWP